MALPIGFIPPCLPTKAPQPPSGSFWLHEIKHDGFRVIARKDGDRVRLYPPSSLTSARWALTPFFLAAGRLRCVLRSLGRGGQGLSDVLVAVRYHRYSRSSESCSDRFICVRNIAICATRHSRASQIGLGAQIIVEIEPCE